MKFSRRLLLLIALIMLGAAVACGGGSSQPVTPVKEKVILGDGTYVFSLGGQSLNSFDLFYYVAGAFKVAGGTITGGEQDLVTYGQTLQATTLHDNISSGTLSTTADGNLQITLTTADNLVGANGVETLSGTLVSKSGSKALITEFDPTATSSGELDLQTSTSIGQGGYAFVATGGDFLGFPAVMGGVVNVDGPGTISGAGSVFDINDPKGLVPPVLQDQPIDPSVVSSPDAFGRVQIGLVLTTSGVGGIGFAGYVVDNKKVRLVENVNDPNDSFQGVMGGTAFAQGGNTGTFSAATVAGSNFVFATNGFVPQGFLQVAGVLTTNADLSINGTLSSGDGIASEAFVGNYTVDTTGRVTVADTTDGFTFEIYLDGNGNGTVASMDNCSGMACDVLAGQAYLQIGAGSFSAGSFSGNYGLDATGIDPNFLETDSVGPVTANGVGSLTGIVDQNGLVNVVPNAGVKLTGDFVANPSGVFTTNAGIEGLDVLNPANQDMFTYYLIDNQRAVAIETDGNQLTLVYLELVH